MWFTKQKEKDEPLKVLKETEIQEKLYGRFRKPHTNTPSSTQAAKASDLNVAAVMNPTSKGLAVSDYEKPKETHQIKSSAESVYTSKTSNKPPSAPRRIVLPRPSRSLRLINISVVIKVLAFSTISVAVFFVTWWLAIQFHRTKSANPVHSARIEAAPAAMIANPQTEGTAKASSDTSTASARTASADQAASNTNENKDGGGKAAAPVSGNYYAIQICTYYTAEDAQKLINEMTAQNLPAFHYTSPIRGSDSKLHMVMLGKDATYPEAQKRLEQFRKTELSNKFSDAYIRRLS